MAITQQITCDVCGKVKGQVNHWWIADIVMNFQLFTWSDDGAKQNNHIHLCGQECAVKKMSEWMRNATK